MEICKRDGKVETFKLEKIKCAIKKCFDENHNTNIDLINAIANEIQNQIYDKISVEEIQDLVEKSLIKFNLFDEAKSYILYRDVRNKARNFNSSLTKIYRDLTSLDSSDMDLKRENANINADTSMGMMLKFGSEASKDYSLNYLIKPEFAQMHKNGDIHIHN